MGVHCTMDISLFAGCVVKRTDILKDRGNWHQSPVTTTVQFSHMLYRVILSLVVECGEGTGLHTLNSAVIVP